MSKDINFNSTSCNHTLTSALTHYSQTFDAKDSKRWALEWIKQNLPDEYDRLEGAKESQFSNRGFVCRMIKMGYKATPEQVNSLIQFFTKIETDSLPKNDSVEVKHRPVEKVNTIIFQLEDIIDQVLSDDSPNTLNIPTDKSQIVPALSWIEKQIIDTQEQISKQQAILAQLESAHQRCGGVKEIKEVKTRVKPVKDPKAALIVEKSNAAKTMKFLKRDDAIGVESLSPAKIVGATEVLIFNTKYRQMIRYRAEVGKVLGVNRSTITNVDAKKSSSKIIRKPLELFSMGDIWKGFELIKTTPREVSSRVSEVCLIVAVK